MTIRIFRTLEVPENELITRTRVNIQHDDTEIFEKNNLSKAMYVY